MKIHAGALVLLLSTAEAFTPLSCRAQLHVPALKMVTKEPLAQETEDTAFKTPKPPQSSPPQEWLLEDEQEQPQDPMLLELQKDGTTETFVSMTSSMAPKSFQEKMDRLVEEMWAQEQTVQAMSSKVRDLTATLNEKTRGLYAFKDQLQQEEDLRLQLDQIQKELTQAQETETKTEADYQTRTKEYRSVQDDLEEQVGGLQKDLVRTRHDLRTEQERYNTLTQRLLEVEGTSDWEVEEFEQEKKGLLTDLDLQKAQFEELSTKWQAEEAEQKKGLVALRAQVESAREAAMQQQVKLEVQRQDHREQRAELQRTIEEQELAVKDAKEALQRCESNNTIALESLQKDVETKQKEYEQLKESTATQDTEFAELESRLEDQLLETTKALERWTYKLQNVQTRAAWEQEFLEERLAAESKRLQTVQSQLEKETLSNNKVRAELQAKLDGRTQRTQSTARNMRKRFGGLRQRLQGQAREAKKKGKETEKTLLERYESDVADLHEALVLLKDSVAFTHDSRRRVQARLEEESKLAQKAVQSQRQLDANMRLSLDKADIEIHRLKKDQKRLVQMLEQRDADIDRMESSLRVILKAGLRLTKDRAGSLRRRVVKKVLRRHDTA